MKRIILFTSLLLVLCGLFLSCATDNKIKSVFIDDTEYKTIYLYSFKDAQIINASRIYANANIEPTESGFIYSTSKKAPGDSIKVWRYVLASSSTSQTFFTDADLGVNAVVDEVIEVYRVKVERKKDTYKITYYEEPSFNTFSGENDNYQIKAHTVEVVKERVMINYE